MVNQNVEEVEGFSAATNEPDIIYLGELPLGMGPDEAFALLHSHFDHLGCHVIQSNLVFLY
jgi:hypothetical protein